ncbi:MAG: hypothetical protein R3F46_15490 [bacterium]
MSRLMIARAACGLLLGLVLASCAGGSAPQSAAAPQVDPRLEGFPGLPLDRSADTVVAHVRKGLEFHSREALSTSVEAPESLKLDAGLAPLSWAIWQIPVGTDELQELEIAGSIPGGSEVLVALGDFTSGRWEFSAPLTEFGKLPLDTQKHASAAGNLACAVLTLDGNTAVVGRLSVRSNDGTLNQPPVASLDITTQGDIAPFQTEISAAGSTDPDGSVVKYEWDFDGDGIFSEPGEEEAAFGSALVLRDVLQTGDFPIGLRVTDNGGAIAEATGVLEGLRWETAAILDSGNKLAGLCLLENNGTLQLAITDGLGRYLGQVPLGQALEPTAWDFSKISNTDSPSFDTQSDYNSLILIDGKPAICFQLTDSWRLMYSVASSAAPAGPADWTEHSTQPVGFRDGGMCSMALVDGRPAFACKGFDGPLLYYHATSANPLTHTDWQHVTVDNGECWNPSLVVGGDRPRIAYNRQGDGVLYAYSDTAAGDDIADWHSLWLVGDADADMTKFGLSMLGGVPVFSIWLRSTPGKLQYARSSTALGSDPLDWQIITLVDTGLPALAANMLSFNGRPAIAHYDQATAKLHLLRSETVTGSFPVDWTDSEQWDIDQPGRRGIAHCIVNGRPLLAWIDSEDVLSVAQLVK